MNPAEIEERNYAPVRFTDLTPADRMNLIQLASSPWYESLKKLMELEVISARDEAMAVDPAKRGEQHAKMTVAHAMAKFCTFLQKRVEFAGIEHLGEIQAAAAKEALKDQEFIEGVVLSQ